MKKSIKRTILYPIITLFLLFFFLFSNQFKNSKTPVSTQSPDQIVNIISETPIRTPKTQIDYSTLSSEQIDAEINHWRRRDARGLKTETLEDGAEITDLDDRFQHVFDVKINKNGHLESN